jgi:hypothetical protein
MMVGLRWLDWHDAGAGRSATRRYRDLVRAWRQSALGRRTRIYFWVTRVDATVREVWFGRLPGSCGAEAPEMGRLLTAGAAGK